MPRMRAYNAHSEACLPSGYASTKTGKLSNVGILFQEIATLCNLSVITSVLVILLASLFSKGAFEPNNIVQRKVSAPAGPNSCIKYYLVLELC